MQDLHGTDFRRAGDRAAGKERCEHLANADIRQQSCPHSAQHLVDGRIGLDAEQLRHLQRADLADQRDVVAQQIDDHPVLGLVLLVVAQERLQPLILGLGRAARRRALHRMRLDHALGVDLEEEFR